MNTDNHSRKRTQGTQRAGTDRFSNLDAMISVGAQGVRSAMV
jgi:hypothetical protein